MARGPAVTASPLSSRQQQQQAQNDNPFTSWKKEGGSVAIDATKETKAKFSWLDFTPVTNDFSCKSTVHPNPIILLHALFVSKDLDLNFFQNWLKAQGYCTFSANYGFIDGIPLGGVRPVNESSREVADFIHEVVEKTGASKVDLVGHSEGGLQALYVAKFRNVSHVIDKIVTIASPTHGTTAGGAYNIATALGKGFEELVNTLLKGVGCAACADFLTGSPVITELTTGPIVQPGNDVTVLASRFDTVATPPRTGFITEPGVENYFVQDFCPADLVGHVGLAIDKNVWYIVRNALDGDAKKKVQCGLSGLPFRRH
ncbi:hypothetical protein ED733_002628 [Metarhizium rileyi]|uniref:AB hydrolase-1 domain-containing protein n=1 Tax=Metarhizium rileyi (strain RCEF 4871) TaxID=1649241 RepID=A0A5C6GD99_METRR|nr:hypothetical protein ED733_002628 [Metarhizium rileyi]